MSIESLTYADLAGRLGTSHEAARSLVRRLRLPRQMGNDGAVRVNIDLAEIRHKPLPNVHRVVIGETLRLSKPKSSSCRLRLSSSKQRKARLKPSRSGIGLISSAKESAATS
jgi:hypothetical protein